MGADGGIKITKISSIKRNWTNIKSRLVRNFEDALENGASYESESNERHLRNSESLPDAVENLSNAEICRLFEYLSSCDCPYLYEASIITAVGDNVPDQMLTLSGCFDGIRIETWT